MSNNFGCNKGSVSRHLFSDGVLALGLAKQSKTTCSFIDFVRNIAGFSLKTTEVMLIKTKEYKNRLITQRVRLSKQE